jgi:hypothetical protein
MAITGGREAIAGANKALTLIRGSGAEGLLLRFHGFEFNGIFTT